MFEQTFKNIDDVLWKEAGCATELDYTEQTSWILFLKYLDDLEKANEQKAYLAGKKYERIIETKHRWSMWAAPKKKDGSFDHDKALTGDDLIKYVDDKLFPYLKGFRSRAKAVAGVPFITISDIKKETSEIDFDDTFFVPEQYFRNLKPNKRPRTGDILYTVTGATLGIPVLVRHDKDFCFQRHIALIRPRQDVDSAWLAYALASPHAYRQATVGSTGAAQKTVSLSVLRNFKIPKLCLPRQKEIAAKLDSLVGETRRLAANYRQKIETLLFLRRSILQEAFSGELTWPPPQAFKEAAE